tara:strand:- start:606 stop:1073 length:468 start_codon:yes stop_codon:yes gene_type:complete
MKNIKIDVSFKSLNGKEILIKSEFEDGDLIVTNYPENEDYYDFSDFLVGDISTGYFKLKINLVSENELWYDVKLLDFKINSEDFTITKDTLLKTKQSSNKAFLKYQLPEGFRKTDFYLISIIFYENNNRNKKLILRGKSIKKSSSLKIKFKLNND